MNNTARSLVDKIVSENLPSIPCDIEILKDCEIHTEKANEGWQKAGDHN